MNQQPTILALTAFSLSLPGVAIGAATDQGTLTEVSGKVEIYTHPGENSKAPSPRVKFEGEMYSVRNASVGDLVEAGFMVRTYPGAQARVVFSNGDQFNIGPGTSYRVPKTKGAPIDILQGKFRAVIETSGPRSGLRFKTKTATMGVRGTDLFINDRAQIGGGTEVTVLRGKAEVVLHPTREPASKGSSGPKTKTVLVESGKTAEIPSDADRRLGRGPDTSAKSDLILVKPLTQNELLVIQKTTVIEASATPKPASVKSLEEKATRMTLTDIKKTDPELHRSLEAGAIQSPDQLNTLVVKKLFAAAPKGNDKPYQEDLEALGTDDVYNKYFKIQ